jgi:hypothetical protein
MLNIIITTYEQTYYVVNSLLSTVANLDKRLCFRIQKLFKSSNGFLLCLRQI